MADSPAHPAPHRKWFWLSALLITALWAVAYMRAFDAPFIFDDVHAITNNRYIRHLWPPWETVYAPNGVTLAGRPVVAYSVAINYQISGLDPWSYHLLNRLLHLGCVLLLLWILWHTVTREPALRDRLGAHGPAFALAAAAIWCVHPLNCESVVYVIQRTELFVAFFFLATLAASMKAFDAAGETASDARASQRYTWWAVAAGALAFLGVMSKEIMVASALTVWIYDRTFVSGSWLGALKRHKRVYLAFIPAYIILGVILYIGPRGATAGFNVGMKPLHYLFTQAWWITWYLRLSFLPTHLSLIYPFDLIDSLRVALPYGSLILALVGLSVWMLVRRHWAGILGAVFFMVLAPSSSFIPVATEVAAERRMYIPLMAVVIATLGIVYAAVRWVIARFTSETASRAVPAPILAVLLLSVPAVALLSVLTINRAELHRNEVAAWEDAVEKYPSSAEGYNNLGYAYVKAKPPEAEKALAAYTKAAELRPLYATPCDNIGNYYQRKGEHEKAIEWYDEAIRRNKTYAEAHFHRGDSLTILGRFEDAAASYKEAVFQDALNGQYRNAYAISLHRLGKEPEAVDQLMRTIKHSPEMPEPYANIARIAARRGDFDAAERFYRSAMARREGYGEALIGLAQVLTAKSPNAVPDEVLGLWVAAIKASPEDAEAREGLALEYARRGKFAEAAAQFLELAKLRPTDASACGNAGLAFTKAGKPEEAVEAFRRAVAREPKSATRRVALGRALVAAGRVDEAIDGMKQAVELEPANGDARLQLGVALSVAKKNEEAVSHLREAVKLSAARNSQPNWDARFLSEAAARLAWALAVRPKVTEAEIKEAVELAEEVAGLYGSHGPLGLFGDTDTSPAAAWDVLGVALARAGLFDKAIEAAEKAIRRAGSQVPPEFEERLKGYREKRAWVVRTEE